MLLNPPPRFLKGQLGLVLVRHVPGHPPETGPVTVGVSYQAGRDFQATGLAVFAAYLPDDIRTLDTGSKNLIEVGKSGIRIIPVHKISIIASLDLVCGISKNTAERLG